jgi:hypothetical protein
MELVQLRRLAHVPLVVLRRPSLKPTPVPRRKSPPRSPVITREALQDAMKEFAVANGALSVESLVVHLPDTTENQRLAHLFERRMIGTDPVYYDME